jgi:hypothetical protein
MPVKDDAAAARRAAQALKQAVDTLTRHYPDTVDVRRLKTDVGRLSEDLDLLCGTALPRESPDAPAPAARGHPGPRVRQRLLDGRRGRRPRPDPLDRSGFRREGLTRMTSTLPPGTAAGGRATITERTLRTDRWWLQPLLTVAALVLFIAYSTARAFENANYYAEPLISPFYSPCIVTTCEGSTFPELFTGPSFISPALYILVVPLGFRLTCYYYRKAYYRSFWMSPPACAVAEPHKTYTGETRFPLLFQNLHRYFFYLGLSSTSS